MEPPRRPRRTDYASQSQSDRLQIAQTALTALADDPDIAAAMGPRGYTADGIAEGQALHDAVRETGTAQRAARNRRLNQTATQDAAVEAADARYRPLADTAAVLFKNRRDDLVALGLTGEHGNSLPERLDRMRDFSRTAREAGRIEAFARIDGLVAEFDALDAAVEAAAAHAGAQDAESSTAQDTSEAKQDDFTDLDEWMETMHGHARIVLKSRPQLLEKLGVRPR